MPDDVVKITVFRQPLRCCFWSNFRDSRDIIGTVSGQGQVFYDPFWRNAEFFFNPGRIQSQVFHSVHHYNPVINQLRKVLVAAYDHGMKTFFSSLDGQRADHVIRFYPGDGDKR